MRVKLCLLILLILLLLLAIPASAQGPILFFPIIFKSDAMTIKSTIGIVSPYGNTTYVLNPSGETTGNFSLQGSATVTRVTTYQKYGLYSYQVAVTASGGGINLTLSSLTSAPHYVTFRVKKPEAVRLNVTIGSATKEARLLERIDTEWSLYWAAFSTAETSGQTNLRITQIGAGVNTMYLDGAQVEPNKLTTYIDGTQEGCRFNGAAHASTSTRSADSRAGGAVKDFWQGYGFFPEKVLGAGAVVEDLNVDSYAFLPGGELNSSKIQPREFTIIGFFLGNSKEDLHEKAQRLELELGLDTYPGRQPVRIRYYGAAVQKEISAHYTGGLEGDLPIFYNDDYSVEDEQWMRHYKFKMKASIQFKALDPFWYEVGESATLLDTEDSATFRVVAARLRSTGQWDALGPPGAGGTYNSISAIAEDATYLYVGGSFTNFDGIAAADTIARYHKQTGVWSAMGTGAPGGSSLFTIVVGPDGLVYAGGNWTLMGGVAGTENVAVWNPATETWAALDTGLGGDVRSLTFSPNGVLYAGGSATGADRVAFWDGAAWNGIAGTGADNTVAVIRFNQAGLLYAGGFFTTINGVTVNYLATWDGLVWDDLNGGTDDNVSSIEISENGLVYVGGEFLTAGGVSVNHVAVWNGVIFSPLGNGVNDDVESIAIAGGFVYLGGEFTSAGGVTLSDRVTRWNGYTFSHLDIDLPGSPEVDSIIISKYDVNPVVPANYTIYLGFNTTGTGLYAGLETVSNGGTAPAFPIIVFSRSGGTSATIATLRNERTGRQLLFNYALLDGETLTIDLNPKNRTIVSSFFGPRMDARLKNDDFSVWQILPGENDITSFVSTTGSPTITGYLLWREPFKSWN